MARMATHPEEMSLILAAQGGDSSAMATLIEQYDRAIAAAAHRRKTYDRDDALQDCRVAFVELVQRFDASRYDSLAQIVGPALSDGTHVGHIALSVPERTFSTWLRVCRETGGDLQAGADLAPKYEMSRMSFLSIADALRVDSLSSAPGEGDEGPVERVATPLTPTDTLDPIAAFDSRDAVARGLERLPAAERAVIERAFGFVPCGASGGTPTDTEIGAHIGGLSRTQVRRLRLLGMESLRRFLAV